MFTQPLRCNRLPVSSSPTSTKLNRNEFFFEHGLQVQMALAERSEPRQYAHPAFSKDVCFRLAQFIDVPPSLITLGHGAEDLLLKILLLLRPSDNGPSDLVLAAFSWGEYRRMASSLGFRLHEIPVRDAAHDGVRSLDLDLGDVRSTVERLVAEGRHPLVLLATTNNPTGASLEPSALAELIQHFATSPVTFILDAVYEPMPSAVFSSFAHSEKVLVLGSFSKYFGLPGLRLGFCVGNLPAAFQLALGPSSGQCAAALAALDDHEHYAAVRREMMTHARALFAPSSSHAGILVYATAAPFLLARIEGCTVLGDSPMPPQPTTLAHEKLSREVNTDPSVAAANDFLATIFRHCERESGVWPKVFEHQETLWMRFGLGPKKMIEQVHVFLERLSALLSERPHSDVTPVDCVNPRRR